MASRNTVVLGFAGLGLLVAGMVAWFLSEGGPAVPVPEPEAAPEAAPAVPARPAAGPAAPAATPVRSAGDGSIRGRLVRGVARIPLAGTVRVPGEGGSPLAAASGPDGRFVLDEAPRGRPLVLHVEAPGVLPADFPIRIPTAGILDVGDLLLGGAVPVEVRVRDPADRPVPEATVTLHRMRLFTQGGMDWISQQFDSREPLPAAFTKSTDEQGRAVFEETSPGTWFVRASAQGFADEGTSTSLVEGALREPVRLVLGPAFGLGGAVLRRDGKPAEGVLVRATRPNAWWNAGFREPTFRTGADGKYRLEGLSRGTVSLFVEVATGVRLTAGTVAIPDVATWDIRLGPAASVRGKVVDDATGAPVPGVEVTAQTIPENGVGAQGTARAFTGEDGTFLIPGLPPGMLGTLGARAKGYLPYPASEGAGNPPQSRLVEGETLEKEIRLRRGGVLRGRVLDRAGKPVAGALVRFRTFSPRGGIEESPVARADAEGAWRIEGAPRAKGLLRAEAPGSFQPDYPLQEWQVLRDGTMPETCSVEVPSEGEAVKDLLLAPGGAVEGVVVDRDGKAAAGMSVTVLSRTKGSTPGGGALSDAEGKFRYVGALPAEDLLATASGPGGLRGTSEPFRVGEGETAQGIRISLKAGAAVAGRVRREDGGDARGASLRLIQGKQDPGQMWNWNLQRQNAPAWPVGPDGAFRAEGLAPGTYTVLCQIEGAAYSEGPVVTLADGEVKEGVEVVLPEERKVAGKVLDPAGAPVAGAVIRVRLAALQNQWFGGTDNEPASATTDAAGAFVVRGLGKGPWRVSARAEGFGEAAQTVEGGKDDVVFNLVAGLSIEGIVTEEGTGAPAAGVSVWANPKVSTPGVNLSRSTVTGKDGAFALRDLAPGAWHLTIGPTWDDTKSDWSPKSQPDVEAGTKDLRISLARGLPISGKVRDEAGKPLTGFWIMVVARDGNGNPDYARQRNGQVQGDGSFRIGGLAQGNHDLTFNANGQGNPGGAGNAPTTVKNVAAGTEDLVVTVRQGLTVSGRIQDEKGNPPGQQGNFQVTASDEAPGSGTVWGNFQADGTFTTPPLDPGRTYDIAVQPVAGTMGGVLKGVVPGQKDAVVIVRKGGTLSGRVLDEAGRAVPAGVPVQAIADDQARVGQPGGMAWGATGANGEFTLSGLGEGRFKVTAGGGNSDFRPTTGVQAFEAGTADIVLTVSAGVSIEGRLSDSRGAWGKEQTWIMAADASAPGGAWHQVKTDGAFTIKGLAPGRVKLQIWREGKVVEVGSFDAPSTGLSITVPD